MRIKDIICDLLAVAALGVTFYGALVIGYGMGF